MRERAEQNQPLFNILDATLPDEGGPALELQPGGGFVSVLDSNMSKFLDTWDEELINV